MICGSDSRNAAQAGKAGREKRRAPGLRFFLLILCSTFPGSLLYPQAGGPLVPALKPGDILFMEEYPYRTIRSFFPPIYMIGRLGYPSVKDFQEAQGLEPDGIVGPETKKMAVELYNQRFESLKEAKKQGKTPAKLSLGAELSVENGVPFFVLIVTNESKEDVRFVGRVSYDHKGNILVKKPAILAMLEMDLVDEDVTAFSRTAPDPWFEFEKGFVIKANSSVTRKKEIQRLKKTDSGTMVVGVAYIDSNLNTVGISTPWLSMPREGADDLREAPPPCIQLVPWLSGVNESSQSRF
jgi:peptidoglycan hydrolase-like protein with peptidoglycan-binding domain